MEREDAATVLSVIEEGDEPEMNAEAFADMAMSGLDMNSEIHSVLIDKNNAAAIAIPQTKLSAYEKLRNGAVHYSRREDKMRVLQEHPVVASVSLDGRTVGCKCGRSVRLNPPWYILKFEQHVASRNCTFLRQKHSRKRKKTEENSESNESLKLDDEAEDYSLQTVDKILRREFGVMLNGELVIKPPTSEYSDHRIRMYKGAVALSENSHCKRMTPDGKFVECKCSRVVLLAAPWQIGQFLVHIAEKQKPKKRAKAASASGWRKKKIVKTVVSSGGPIKPPTSTSTLLQTYTSKKSFPREIRWDVARARGLLPCPGLRDERMNSFVTSAVQLTGGGRHRQKIAREIFPHLFSDTLTYGHADDGGEHNHFDSQNIVIIKRYSNFQQQLLEAEKLLLHDVIEGEALWFVDKDGNSVRSLDCLGVVDTSSAEVRCASCTALRSNAALRTAAASQHKVATRMGRPRNPINRKFCSGRVCALLEAEFDMQEPYAKVLRDLALADIPIASNIWMEMASLGLSGEFDSHVVLLGLIEAMVRLKDKEQRGVGLQNMTYSDHLDTFMCSLTDTSSEACELFQRHLGGRKQRQVLAGNVRRTQQKQEHSITTTDRNQHIRDSLNDDRSNLSADRTSNDDRFDHLLESSIVGLHVPHLSISDIQDVDLATFSTTSNIDFQSNDAVESAKEVSTAPSAVSVHNLESVVGSFEVSTVDSTCSGTERQSNFEIESGNEATFNESSLDRTNGCEETNVDAEESLECDSNAIAFLSEIEPFVAEKDTGDNDIVLPTDHVPCTGLRDDNVQAYVSNAVQIVGGSRPRYVIARELFPRVFGNDEKVRIVDKLTDDQRLVLQDAVFSECLWRVDKEGRCVRSLRCKRFVPVADNQNRTNSQSRGVCGACRDLRTVPNFRSVLSRSKVPKKLENIKYVPSVYTESDPFLRKLSKNSAFRGLYQTVKHMVSSGPNKQVDVDAERRKQVQFWLRFARMGVFGQFKSHPVFEGLMKSMVEMKDKERRGVGKQNMQYSRALDEFMQSMAQISTEAFELFVGQFCGRTLRSQKVKRRSMALTTVKSTRTEAASTIVDDTVTPKPQPSLPTLSSHQHQQFLMPSDDLLGGRSLSSEESQRFMDRMLDEVRFSVSQEMQLAEDEAHCRKADASTLNDDLTNRLGPETYLNDDGVLITDI
ncbi:uncharacterized protein PHALS_10595 [Plasmopara halstedii]|uniref:Uncharacterized protein n=1 Tax=Plasmopara halstedii TaxID=4781 RepID=A0A0P1AI66_PLAHL|nr:uncharacterized protein PHALS_10595 [Plasmopara halstedii]CEG40392.1 hypothetical protein PHALS_10595 [Plasmopara halstedii]|eukprot:XP_024576761.1 hypothetical protein PHALS_10595 [Plasmopara halstedii]